MCSYSEQQGKQTMIQAIVIGTDSQRITVLEGSTAAEAEKMAKEFIVTAGLKFITHIFSMGQYRVWAE